MLSIVSLRFMGFLILLFILYFLAYRFAPKYQWTLLLVFSAVYYYVTAGLLAFIPLGIVALSTFLGALLLHRMQDGPGRTAVFISLLVIEIGTLAFFKYAGYIAAHTEEGSLINGIFSDVVMCLGISFYVFQCTGYLIDIYRRKYEPEKNVLKYLLYAGFFLQIGQGPIGRYDRLSPTLFSSHGFDYDRFTEGAVRVLIGCFKKSVIADNICLFVDDIYWDCSSHSGIVLLFTSVMYSLQLYADFSGYMDIVVGAGKQLGVELDENFRTPYFATSIRDFWQRWHITLSTWLRDYVYIPLGGSRRGTFRKCVNQMVTMLISGIWHGTGLTFLIWGGIHGACQVAENFLPGYRDKKEPTGVIRYIRMAITFIVVNIAWIFFRIPDMATMGVIWDQVIHSFRMDGWTREIYVAREYGRSYWMWVGLALIVWFVMEIIHTKKPVERAILDRAVVLRWAMLLVMLFVTIMFALDPEITGNNFIYYQF